MKEKKDAHPPLAQILGGTQSPLEQKFIEEYLERKGQSLSTISALPEAEAKALMKEACSYASLKLAEIESRSHLRESIRLPG